MNIMIATMEMGNGFAAPGGSDGGVVFVALFSVLGLALLSIAACILRGCESPSGSLVRYTEIRH